MADENGTFPTEINRSFIYLDQILFHCKLGFPNVVEYSPSSLLVYQKCFHKLSQKAGNFGAGGLKNLRAGLLWGGFTCIREFLWPVREKRPKNKGIVVTHTCLSNIGSTRMIT